MFKFSTVHDWQNDTAVKQVLVFSSNEAKELFYSAYQGRILLDGVSNASDSGIGAVYKLRAVKDNTGKYIPLIRCGFTGKLLWENAEHFENYLDAIDVCVKQIYTK